MDLHRGYDASIEIGEVASLESFFAVAQMAVSGFGHGLVPIGVARTLGVEDRNLIKWEARIQRLH